ncbi:MAG TPA: hypothetical protein VD993_08170 [Chitinophagaceae bacterium]|nr:hypothetical protein [Chitinophagaceae bacterium]
MTIKLMLASIAGVMLITHAGAQSISPGVNDEHCPATNITFSVTLPNTHATNPLPNVIGWANLIGGIVVSNAANVQTISGTTTFTFVGRFSDNNSRQSFRVYYRNPANTEVYTDFTFMRIKSLYPQNNTSTIQPNPASLNPNACEEVPYTITFTNVKYVNVYEAPPLQFGTVTNYEYLLPAGWKRGTDVSDGVTWMADDNSVSITSDKVTGGFLQIRPVNTACGAGLEKGPITSIPISRPGPPLSMSGTTPLCYPNDYTYSVSGIPINGSISWAPHSYYSITGSGSSVTISPTSSANGLATISAEVSITGCSLTFPVSKNVSFGTPYIGFSINAYPGPEPCCYEVGAINTFQAVQSSGHGSFTHYEWGYRFQGNEVIDPSLTSSTFPFIPWDPGTYVIFVKAVNQCGVSTLESTRTVEVYSSCGGGCGARYLVTLLPNPAKGFIQLRVTENAKPIKPSDKKADIVIELYENTTFNKVKVWKFNSRQAKYGLDVRSPKKGNLLPAIYRR